MNDQHEVLENKKLNIWEALIPLLFLVAMLAFINNPKVYGDNGAGGPNQFALILSAFLAVVVGHFNGISFQKIIDQISENIRQTSSAILILLLVGALAGTWMLSGVIPAMVYYGLDLLSPKVFLAASVVISAIISLATGSSWTTSATIGIALIGIGRVIGIHEGMIAGAVISGAYFGDKLSPMSDTTNLAPAMAGTDLFTHIRYMMLTTVPSIVIALVVFIIVGFSMETNQMNDLNALQQSIENTFNVSPILFLIPTIVIVMIVRKTSPLIALLVGALLAGVFSIIFQPDLVLQISGAKSGESLNFKYAFQGVMNAITNDIYIESGNAIFDENELFSASGMKGMMGTIWLILSAMMFGGAMEAIGALSRISEFLLRFAKGVFGLFASTVASCLAINIAASDQYLAIVVPGKMFKEAYEKKNLAPENLSRTLEDSGTVTSVLIPWNTCGAYQASVLGVDVFSYLPWAIFNYVSPIMTLIFAALNLKLRSLKASKH